MVLRSMPASRSRNQRAQHQQQQASPPKTQRQHAQVADLQGWPAFTAGWGGVTGAGVARPVEGEDCTRWDPRRAW